MGNPEWYEKLDPHWLTEAEWIEADMGRPPLEDSECIRRAVLVDADFDKHKFRYGEYFDRYLYKMLKKHELSIKEYYWGIHLMKQEGVKV